MDNNRITRDVSDQYKRSIGMFRDAVTLFPEHEWRKGELDYLRPAGVACHVIECLDFYTDNRMPEEFPWGQRFGIDWTDPDSDKLPDQKQVLGQLDEIEQKLDKWFQDNDLIAENPSFQWSGTTLLGRAVYGIRHIQHHLSEMSLELTRRGYDSPKWR